MVEEDLAGCALGVAVEVGTIVRPDRRLPDAGDVICVEDSVGGDDGGAFTDGLCHEQTVKGVVVNRRERAYSPGVDIGDRQALERELVQAFGCLLYTSPSPRDRTRSRMPSSA